MTGTGVPGLDRRRFQIGERASRIPDRPRTNDALPWTLLIYPPNVPQPKDASPRVQTCNFRRSNWQSLASGRGPAHDTLLPNAVSAELMVNDAGPDPIYQRAQLDHVGARWVLK